MNQAVVAPPGGMMTRPVGFAYDVDPVIGRVYSTEPRGNWVRSEAPRGLAQPGLALPPPAVMRDPTDPTTFGMTGGARTARPNTARRFVPPVPAPRPAGFAARLRARLGRS